ncbi:MAG TPA: MFS transporter [Terriglobia bacterium]
MSNPKASRRAALDNPDFLVYQLARLIVIVGLEMQSVAVGWQVYEVTRQPLALGFVGLAQFLPAFLLFLISGHAADRFDRRRLLTLCYVGFALCSALLLYASYSGVRSVSPIYVLLVLIGVVRSFSSPASRAILPQLVREEHFQSAVAWNATVFQSATLLGPALGGVVYAIFGGPSAVYATAALASGAAALLTLRIRPRARRLVPEEVSFQTVFAGLRYIFQHKVILGSISLDLFAVFFGGAVALLPVYARELLHTGPWGLGLLRSAPAIGALVMAVLLARRPLRGRVGAILFWCVAGFGVFTILFGVSRSLVLSMIALLLVGAFDMVSVIIRNTLVQVATPDRMRGRVTAVEMIFLGASNELGEFESGLTAHWFGTVPAVILGGVGALLVTALWAYAFPELRKADQIMQAAEE